MPKLSSFTIIPVSEETFSDHVHHLHTEMLDEEINRREALMKLRKTIAGMTAAHLALALAPAHISAQEKDDAPTLTFDGKDDALIAPMLHYKGNAPICIDTVVTPSSTEGTMTIAGNHHSGGVGLSLDDGTVEFVVHNGKQYLRIRSDQPLQEDISVHITALCDGQSSRLYINGKLQKNMMPWSGRHRASKHPIYIGADPDAAGIPQHLFEGSIQQMRISAIARDRSDIWKKHPFGKPDAFDALYLDPATGKDQSRFQHQLIWQGKDDE